MTDAPSKDTKRSRIFQTEIPRYSLEDALRIPEALAENFGKDPTSPLMVAKALDLTPTGGHFRSLCGAAIGYGLTDGGYNAEEISLTDLGRKIVAPLEEGADREGLKEALLEPQIISKFLGKYDGSRLPNGEIATNVLEQEMGLPASRAEDAYEVIIESAEFVGALTKIKGELYVTLENAGRRSEGDIETPPERSETPPDPEGELPDDPTTRDRKGRSNGKRGTSQGNRVFITHGSNFDVVDQLKDILRFGNFDPVVSVEEETVSKPVPEKVLDDMRSCYAAIIHVGTEKELLTSEGETHRVLNPNVLIEIGAAMALYGQKFILLVEEGVELPSNLQGLYEVRYAGDKLDYEATMKLLKAFNEFKEQ